MTEAIVVLCLWAELGKVCIAGTGGGVRKLVVFATETSSVRKKRLCLQDTSDACINNPLHFDQTDLSCAGRRHWCLPLSSKYLCLACSVILQRSALTWAPLCAGLEAAERLPEQPDSAPSYAGKLQAPKNPLMEPVAGAGARRRAGGPARPRAPAPEPPQGVKEAGRRVKCAAFYLRCYCLYGGCGPSAC